MPRLRWLTLLARDPDLGVPDLLGLSRCSFEEELEGFGVSSAVYPLGADRFLEVCAPVRPGTSAARRLERAGEGLYMAIFQVDSLAAHRDRLAAENIRVVAEFDREQTRGRWASLHLHPADTGGALLSLDVSDPPEDFTVVEGDWRSHVRTSVVTDLRGLEIDAPADRWAAATGGGLTGDTLRLDDAVVTFRPGPTRVLLDGPSDRDVTLGGVEFQVRT